MQYRQKLFGFVAAATMVCSVTARAQAQALPESVLLDWFANPETVDRAALSPPDLTFQETSEIARNYDKYFIFHRPDNNFVEAVRDVTECDQHASGMAGSYGYQQPPYPYSETLVGAAGGAIANVLVQAIAGSAERRRMRRVTMRRCMFIKGYARYGIDETIWRQFHFEEGLGTTQPAPRARALLLQAMVASAPTAPQGQELGL